MKLHKDIPGWRYFYDRHLRLCTAYKVDPNGYLVDEAVYSPTKEGIKSYLLP